ncbi:hypothetical protein [Kordia sp.]|uniref:hypothetical protein n=1 Tax=Kordia sp. TaxID=1965332 RepID=UPI003D2BD43E
MKSLATFFLITILFSFVACKQEKETVPKSTPNINQEKVNSHESETPKSIDLTSKLEEKITRLATLEHHYQVKSIDVVLPEKTVLLWRLQHALTLKDSLATIADLTKIKSNIHEVRTSFLKGTKPMRPNGTTYPRVTIEEYIFNTPESAKTAFNILMESKKNVGLWTYVSKSPNALFVEENRMYFIDSGGYYMMEIYSYITEKIKN